MTQIQLSNEALQKLAVAYRLAATECAGRARLSPQAVSASFINEATSVVGQATPEQNECITKQVLAEFGETQPMPTDLDYRKAIEVAGIHAIALHNLAAVLQQHTGEPYEQWLTAALGSGMEMYQNEPAEDLQIILNYNRAARDVAMARMQAPHAN